MEDKKFNLEELKIHSFVTSIDKEKTNTIKGGLAVEIPDDSDTACTDPASGGMRQCICA